MSQIFSPLANVLARYGPLALIAILGLVAFAWVRADWSPWETRQGRIVRQPVPFSHEHHVSGLGLDCRYCHSQVWTEAPVLEPVRRSYREDRPIQWVRVHDLPDYVYFDHSIHVNKGVACESCHGRVDQMPITYKDHALYM